MSNLMTKIAPSLGIASRFKKMQVFQHIKLDTIIKEIAGRKLCTNFVRMKVAHHYPRTMDVVKSFAQLQGTISYHVFKV